MTEKTVLIVEDDLSMSEFLDVAIKAAGHRTILAFDGEDAVTKFRRMKPDLVIVDVLIPKMDGLQVCAEIRKHKEGRTVPVVLMSGIYTKRSYRQEAIGRVGANEYLFKPFGINEVSRILLGYLGNGSSLGRNLPVEGEEEAEFEDEELDRLPGAFSSSGGSLGRPLRETPLAQVLAENLRNRSTGLLFVKHGKETYIFYLDRGQVIFIRSNDPEMRLDRVLVKMQRVTEAQYREAQNLFRVHRARRRMGEILVGMGFLGRKDLEEALRYQFQLMAGKALQWTDGTFHFVEGELPNREEVRVAADTRALIFNGIKLLRDARTILRGLPHEEALLSKTRDSDAIAAGIGLTATEQQMLDLIDGTKPWRKVRSIGRLANVDIENLMYAFLCAGFVRVEQGPEVPGTAAAPQPAPVISPGTVLSGNLSERPFPSLLNSLYQGKKTGVLTVQREGLRKWLQVERGEVIFAGSEDPGDRIGRVLVEAKLVSHEEVEAAAREQLPDGTRRIGRVLVDKRLITLDELYWAVVFQVQRIVLSLFVWDSGRFLFREGELPTRETITLDLNTPNLILEGIRRCPLEVLAGRGLPRAARFRKTWSAEDIVHALRLSTVEGALFRWLAGEKTVEEASNAGLGEETEVRRAIHGLLAVGLAERTDIVPEGDSGIRMSAGDSRLLDREPVGPPAGEEPDPGPADGAEEAEGLDEEVEAAFGPAPPPKRRTVHAPPASATAVETREATVRSAPASAAAVAHSVPRPSPAPPRPVPGATPEPQVPKFLYDEIVAERSDLEKQILAYNDELCQRAEQIAEAMVAVRALERFVKDGEGRDAWNRLLQILDHAPDREG